MHEFARTDTTPHGAGSPDADTTCTQRARHTFASHLDQIVAACRAAPSGGHVVAWIHADGAWGDVSTPIMLGGISRVTVPRGAIVVYLAADPRATRASVSAQLAGRPLQSLATLAAATVTS